MATVTVYVRKGRTDLHRTLSFRRLPEMSATQVLSRGYALDGNQVLLEVAPVYTSGPQPTINGFVGQNGTICDTLAGALSAVEDELRAYLEAQGHQVEFD